MNEIEADILKRFKAGEFNHASGAMPFGLGYQTPEGLFRELRFSTSGGTESEPLSYTPAGWTTSQPIPKEGQPYTTSNLDGSINAQHTIERMDDPMEKVVLGIILAMAGGAAFAGMGGGAAAGNAGGFIGEGAASGIGAWDGALAGAGDAFAAGGGGLTTTSMGAGPGGGGITVPTQAELGASFASDFSPYLSNGTGALGSGYTQLSGDAVLPGQLGVDGANMSKGVLPGLEKYVAPGLLSSASKYLGPASTAAGALAGSQPQTASQTSARELPEYLKGPVADLIARSQGLLAQQMDDPARRQQLEQFKNSGFGLLNTPFMGNGFNKFYGGK